MKMFHTWNRCGDTQWVLCFPQKSHKLVRQSQDEAPSWNISLCNEFWFLQFHTWQFPLTPVIFTPGISLSSFLINVHVKYPCLYPHFTIPLLSSVMPWDIPADLPEDLLAGYRPAFLKKTEEPEWELHTPQRISPKMCPCLFRDTHC